MLNEQEIAALLDDSLLPEKRARLEELLEDDPSARAQLREQSRMDNVLCMTLGGATAHERVKQSILAVVRGGSEEAIKQQVLHDTTFASRGSRREEAQTKARQSLLTSAATNLMELFRRPAWAFSFAVICVCLGLGAWLVLRANRSQSLALASLIELPVRVELLAQSVTPKSGETLRVTGSGSGTVKFADGTTLHLEPGTEIRFQPVTSVQRAGGKQLQLIRGVISADVTKQPEKLPLLIETPHALVTVVGTEFDLNVATNRTELEVTRGLVKLTSADASRPVSVAAGEFAVAAPKAGMRYGRLARNPYFWPFSSASPWNTPIGSGAKYEPLPVRSFLADGPLMDAVRGRRPFIGRATDPLRNLWVKGERRADIRFADPGALPQGKADSVVLLQHARRYALEVRGLTIRADGDLEAEDIERTSLLGAGMDSVTVPAKPYGLSQLGGLIRAGEYERGIPHALSARVNRERLGGRVNFSQPSAVWPATGGADASDEFLNIGSLLAIPPDVDIRQVVGASGPAYELARAMQDYGVYVTGFIDAPFVLLAGEARLDRDKEDVMVNKLVPLLKIIANNTPQTPGGGGTPRREPAPALPAEAK